MVITSPFLGAVGKSWLAVLLERNRAPSLKLSPFSRDRWFHQLWSIKGDCLLRSNGTMPTCTLFLAYPADNWNNSSCPEGRKTRNCYLFKWCYPVENLVYNKTTFLMASNVFDAIFRWHSNLVTSDLDSTFIQNRLWIHMNIFTYERRTCRRACVHTIRRHFFRNQRSMWEERKSLWHKTTVSVQSKQSSIIHGYTGFKARKSCVAVAWPRM